MKKFLISSMMTIIGLASYAQDLSSDSIINKEPNRLDFKVGLATSHLTRGLIIRPTATATADIRYALDKKQNVTIGVWGANISNNRNMFSFRRHNRIFDISSMRFKTKNHALTFTYQKKQ